MNSNPIQPHSNERDELIRLLPELADRDLPSGRERQLQEFVMSQIHQDRPAPGRAPHRPPTRRFVVATAAVATAAVAAVAIGTGGFGGGRGADVSAATPGSSATPGTAKQATPPAARLSPVARTFELAAAYASARPFTPPRPDQWIYTQDRILNPSSLAKSKGQGPEAIYQTWIRVDGKKRAVYNREISGRLDIWNQTNEYPVLSTLPTDPSALGTRLRTQLLTPPWVGPRERVTATEVVGDRTDALFRRIATILDDYLLPPAVTAALMRVAATIPGVTLVPGTIPIHGRQVTAIGRVQEGWLFEQLLLDPETHEFVGYRSVAVKNHTFDTGGGTSIAVRKGDVQYITTRLAAKIVDAPGQTS